MKDVRYKGLEEIYQLHADAIKEVDAKCEKQCASCCTCNVVMTSLEARYLLSSMGLEEKKVLKKMLEDQFPPKRYIPELTTNQFARYCIEGKQIPEEQNDPSWGNCPALNVDLCTLYEVRPFGCRALLSQGDCSQLGYAQMPPIVLTINDICMQVIEQMDQNGICGNFSDIMALFLSENVPKDLPGMVQNDTHSRFLINEKITVLMVPPEHRKQLSPLLEKISAIRIRGL